MTEQMVCLRCNRALTWVSHYEELDGSPMEGWSDGEDFLPMYCGDAPASKHGHTPFALLGPETDVEAWLLQ